MVGSGEGCVWGMMNEDNEAGEGSRRGDLGMAMKSRKNPMCICMIQLEELEPRPSAAETLGSG